MATPTNNPFNPPAALAPVLASGQFSVPWYQWFAMTVARALLSPVTSAVPASRSAPGTFGQVATDGNFLYVAVGVNSWKRVALTAF